MPVGRRRPASGQRPGPLGVVLVPVGVFDGLEPDAFGDPDEFTVPVDDIEPVVEPLPVRPRLEEPEDEPDVEPKVEPDVEPIDPVSGMEPDVPPLLIEPEEEPVP